MKFGIFLLCFLTLVALQCVSIPVYLMLPLTTVTSSGLQGEAQLRTDLAKIKSGGLAGVMVDVWWGLVESTQKSYNWTAYRKLADLVKASGLKLQPVMSFHQCGGNVGDTCNVPLPSWVLSVGSSNPAIYYTDREGNVDKEYLSLGVDNKAVFNGRTALQLYGDFMKSFATEFKTEISGSSVIDEIMIGLGPASELRYPSYQSSRWSYCGVGEFQCYDSYMLADLQAAATSAGHSEWGHGGPSNAGTYNSKPSETGFFASGNDNYASDYGKFFLSWYFESLLKHGSSVLSVANDAFGSFGVPLGAKVSGIHWWYNDNSHAAELTAGYYNANGHDAYLTLGQSIKSHAKTFDFTCLEMTDSSNNCGSKPVELVAQAMKGAHNAGLEFDGENALELCNPNCYKGGFDQIVNQAKSNGKVQHFTYLRLTRNLLDNSNNWAIFTDFVSRMSVL